MGSKPSVLEDDKLRIIPRKQWEARKPFYKDPMVPPVTSVMFLQTHPVRFPKDDERLRYKLLRHIQMFHMYRKLMPDIQYNFMIDEYGCIFEGRGWYVRPSVNPGPRKLSHVRTIYVGLITKNPDDPPPLAQTNAANDFLNFGMRNEVITYHHHISGKTSGIMGTTLEDCLRERALAMGQPLPTFKPAEKPKKPAALMEPFAF